MRVKICGITQPEQAKAIALQGATTLGFICVPKSPRYIEPENIRQIINVLPDQTESIGVFANASIDEISNVITQAHLTGVQLHGQESPLFCQHLRKTFPKIELIKALRIKNLSSLSDANFYFECVDTLLLDAYHPNLLGGTGNTLNWESLSHWQPKLPWLLAGGLSPENILDALTLLKPDGIDLSSGVERSPGDKDLQRVALLFEKLQKTIK